MLKRNRSIEVGSLGASTTFGFVKRIHFSSITFSFLVGKLVVLLPFALWQSLPPLSDDLPELLKRQFIP
jgi:hypothetical protein